MTANRILIIVLVLNLFATLLVFRGMLVLADRFDRIPCAGSAGVPAAPAQHRLVAPRTGSIAEQLSEADEPKSELTAAADTVVADQLLTLHAGLGADAASTDNIARIKSQFASQYSDSVWTAEVQKAVQTVALDNPAYTGIIQEMVECKERICKLALGYRDPESFDAFIGQLTETLADGKSATLYFGEPSTLGGNSRVELYLERE